MKLKIKALLGLAMMSVTANANVQLGTYDCSVDTLQHSVVGPGMTYTALKFTPSATGVTEFRVFLLYVDTQNPNLKIHAELGRDSIIGVENISNHTHRCDAEGRRYVAAVNGDFFHTTGDVGTPVYGCVVAGKQATPPPAGMPHYVITDEHIPYISNITPTHSLSVNGGEAINIDNINSRGDNQLALFNDNIGKYTHTSAGGVEVAIELLPGESWKINTPFKVKVVGAKHTNGNMAVQKGKGVLSAVGTKASIVENLKEGDEIEISVNWSLDHQNKMVPNITSVMGAFPLLVENGQKIVYDNPDVHPRTMLGYTADQKTAVFAVLDGRSTISRGGNFEELSDIMIYAGCHWAVNTDGGGSSSMYLPMLGTMNKPSGGMERAVGNGLYVTLDVPDDNEIAEIHFKDWAGVFPKYGIYTPVVYGYNKYGQLINTDVKVQLSCPSELGEIIKDGTTLFANGGGTYALTATYGDNITTTIPVTIDATNSPELIHTNVLLDNYRKWTVEIQTLVGEEYMPVGAEAMSWTSSDETVATISELGEVVGLKDGTSTLSGVVGDFSGNINLTVECPTANAMPIDNFADVASWKATKSGLGTATLSSGENSSLKADYTITNTRSAKLTLAKTVQVWSLPDKIRVKIKPGNATFSDVSIKATPSNSRVKTISLTGTTVGDEIVYEMPVTELDETNSIGMYPISFGSLVFTVSGATSTNYSFELTGLEAIYDNFTAGVGTISSDEKNNGVYVTPDNILVLGEDISEVFVYTISGQLVEKVTATGNYSLDNLASGIYILNVKNDAGVSAIKFIK